MHSTVPIDHTSNGCRSCVANASDQTRRPAEKKKMKKEKNLIEQKARPTAAISHRNKSSAKRQLCKWAGLAALLQQFAENWKMLSAQHDCTLRTRTTVQGEGGGGGGGRLVLQLLPQSWGNTSVSRMVFHSSVQFNSILYNNIQQYSLHLFFFCLTVWMKRSNK